MSDIVERLRSFTEADAYEMPWTFGRHVQEAADLIEEQAALLREAEEASEPLATMHRFAESADDGEVCIVSVRTVRRLRALYAKLEARNA